MTEKEEQNNSEQALQLRARIDAKETTFTRESADRDQLNRQYSLLKSKTTDALDTTQEIQSMKTDLDEDPTVTDEWTVCCKGQLCMVKWYQ